jgi:hypothetical protein
MQYNYYICIMRTHNGMRPQDIVILLQISLFPKDYKWKVVELSSALEISQSEISESLNRSLIAGLINYTKKEVFVLSLMEFLQFGIKYVFPQKPGAIVRGTPTAHSHIFMKSKIISSENYVWPNVKGNTRGQAIEPLIKSVVNVVALNDELYKLLALVDVLRVGKNREKNIAIQELKISLLHES